MQLFITQLGILPVEFMCLHKEILYERNLILTMCLNISDLSLSVTGGGMDIFCWLATVVKYRSVHRAMVRGIRGDHATVEAGHLSHSVEYSLPYLLLHSTLH